MGRSISHTTRWVRRIGLWLGPTAALFTYLLLPEDFVDAAGDTVAFTPGGRATLAVMSWMAVWWLTEAIDIAATALLPLVVFPLVGAASMKAAAAPYAHPMIFLFMGGFLLALSMQRWQLDRRIALITLRIVGARPINMVGGFMIATAMLSAFVSNTATTAMMLPIALSVVALVKNPRARAAGGADSAAPPHDGSAAAETGDHFALCLMLGIAYAASIGGIATIIGTPPNTILVGFISDKIAPEYQREVSFVSWMVIGVPLAVIFLPLVWILLTRVIYPIRLREVEGGRELIRAQYKALGRTSAGEWATFIVFCCTALLWLTRPLLSRYVPGLSDPGIAMLGALVLFVIPVVTRSSAPEQIDARREWRFVMNWKTAGRLPWGILILFGGGLSLADAVTANGVAEFFGAQAAAFVGAPDVLLVIVIAAAVIFLTELTSNTGTTTTLLPILAALAPGLGVHPYLLIVPAALAASCAFMMPVATPPNAIVFGSGHVTIPQMCRAGLCLNLIGVLLVTLLTWLIVRPVLGI